MKRTTYLEFCLTTLLLLAACGPSTKSSESASAVLNSQNTVGSEKSHDHFTFRDADTNEVVSDAQMGQQIVSQKFSYLVSTKKTWPGGVIKWTYNPEGQPAFLDTNEVVDLLKASAKKWETVCGVSFQYEGITTRSLTLTSCDGSTVVGWTPLAGNVVGQTQACFNSTGFTEMDVGLDNTQINSLQLLDSTAIHEFGHGFGLGHTDVTPAVMTPILTTANPVADDVEGCQSLYGASKSATPAPAPTPVPQPAPVPAPVCQAGTTQSCDVLNGSGAKICSADGQSWGSCKVVSCKSGFELKNGACVAVVVAPTPTPTPVPQPTPQPTPIPLPQPTLPKGMICLPQSTKMCSSGMGTGIQTCGVTGKRWSSCELTQCKSGYQLTAGRCKRVR